MENMNDTFEAIKNWRWTFSTGTASWATDKEQKYSMSGSVSFKEKVAELKKN